MARNLFLDFDGSLIDSRQRQYKLFCDSVPESQFSFDEYWQIKRQGVSQAKMLTKYFGYDNARIATMHATWMKKIEEPARLALDTPFEGIDRLLNEVSTQFTLYLVTARQNSDLVIKQLDKFNWLALFAQILVTEQRFSKLELIEQNVVYNISDIIIGDTGEDITTGKSLGLHTVAVSYGTLNAEILNGYSPDVLVGSSYALKEHLLTKM